VRFSCSVGERLKILGSHDSFRGICGEFLRILVAEDYEAVRKGVCAILRTRSDIEVCGEADNGKEAVQKASALRPDLIILDLTIPMLSGFEAAREIRKTLPDVPILILSMHESKLLIEEAKKLGVQGYVIKREIAKTLLLAVDTLLRNQTFYADII
jgi:two-component system, NarL family, nitrate/nitrite response regulator NarL